MLSVHQWKLLCIKSLGKGWRRLNYLDHQTIVGQWERGSEGPASAIECFVLDMKHIIYTQIPLAKGNMTFLSIKVRQEIWFHWDTKRREKNQMWLSTRSLDIFTTDGDCFSGKGNNSFSHSEKSRAESAGRVRDTQTVRNAFIHLFI